MATARLEVLVAAVLFGTTGTALALGPDTRRRSPSVLFASSSVGRCSRVVALLSGGFRGHWPLRPVLVAGVGVAVYQVAFFEAVDADRCRRRRSRRDRVGPGIRRRPRAPDGRGLARDAVARRDRARDGRRRRPHVRRRGRRIALGHRDRARIVLGAGIRDVHGGCEAPAPRRPRAACGGGGVLRGRGAPPASRCAGRRHVVAPVIEWDPARRVSGDRANSSCLHPLRRAASVDSRRRR